MCSLASSLQLVEDLHIFAREGELLLKSEAFFAASNFVKECIFALIVIRDRLDPATLGLLEFLGLLLEDFVFGEVEAAITISIALVEHVLEDGEFLRGVLRAFLEFCLLSHARLLDLFTSLGLPVLVGLNGDLAKGSLLLGSHFSDGENVSHFDFDLFSDEFVICFD